MELEVGLNLKYVFTKKEKRYNMNIQECDVLKCIKFEKYINQRSLAETSGHSLGIVNRSLKHLQKDEYINNEMQLTQKAENVLVKNKSKRAIILAAGFGMRMVPLNTEIPKGLLEIKGETFIEHTIKQLHEAGIYEIYVVVGFMKEKYEYLIDEYNVQLIVNPEYAQKNNLYSLKLALSHIENAYIIPCDVWCKKNPFSRYELYSWYMVSDKKTQDSTVRVNRNQELILTSEDLEGNTMIGISYFTEKDGKMLQTHIAEMCKDKKNDGVYWEDALYHGNKMTIVAKVVANEDVYEVNTYEQFREIDNNADQLKTDAIQVICKVFHAKIEDIKNIMILKKGMTNRSFLFTLFEKRYIMRIPGEGTDFLIDRKHEAEVYQVIKSKGICDNVIYINAQNGYKITEYLEKTRTCDSENLYDVKKCIKKLKMFHDLKLKVRHEFNIFDQLEFYEKLWNGETSIYRDYKKTKENIISLKKYIEKNVQEKVLTHIDAVPDNFLIANREGKDNIYLIDWEYAGMQDPHVDIAMFCIYAFYEKAQIDQVIDLYFEEQCDLKTRVKIYCYIAVCGLLWSNWCEYKRQLGVEFGEYSLKQYRYAKEFYRVAIKEIQKMEESYE